MRNVKREVECLQRLHQLTPTYEELLQFLEQELLMTREELKAVRASPEQAKLLQARLALLSRDRKLQLLEYEWALLPVERIRITLVTNNTMKEIQAEP
jgi:hypothetical protein